MATAHVSGAWALLKSRRPSASVSQVLSVLQSTGPRITDPLSNLAFPRVRVDEATKALALTQTVLDMPAAHQTVASTFTVAGWAVDRTALSGTGVDAVHVYAYPTSGAPVFLGAAAYGINRPDVGGLFGEGFTNSGFTLTAQGLPSGTYQIIAYAHSAISGAFDGTALASITVPDLDKPQGVIEDARGGGDRRPVVHGERLGHR